MTASGLVGLRDVLVPPRCAGCAAAGSWYCVTACGARGVRAYVVAFEE